MSLFDVKNASYRRKTRIILEHINFSLKAGEILAILGCNGVGKTTLLKCCMGLLKWNDGKSFLEGINITTLPNSLLWQKISYVPQAKNINIGIKVLDMVLLGLNPFLKLSPNKEHLLLALQALENLGITRLKDEYCHSLSGGELQMVLFGRALVSNPSLLVLDEPESNLDIKNQIKILDTLSSLCDKGVGIIFNTHYPAHAKDLSHQTLMLFHQDNILHNIYGKTKDVLNPDNLGLVFDVPSKLFQS